MKQKALGTAAVVAVCMGSPAFGGVVEWFIAENYTEQMSSPWIGTGIGFGYFGLNDFEPTTVVSGLSMSGGAVRGPNQFTDSVDGDDGVIDGSGNDGYSYWSTTQSDTVTATFDLAALGTLPTHAGFVWTDGNPFADVLVTILDGDGGFVDSYLTVLGDDVGTGTTAEDTFIGARYDGGIGSFTVQVSGGIVEVDHVQFGAVPGPSALALLVGAGVLGRRRRRV